MTWKRSQNNGGGKMPKGKGYGSKGVRCGDKSTSKSSQKIGKMSLGGFKRVDPSKVQNKKGM